MIVDLSANPKQFFFFGEVMKAVLGHSDKRKFLYGGAIRGGKSFICATIFLKLTGMFPNSRWHVIRADFPAMQGTIIPTFEKIIDGSSKFKWSRDKSNYFVINQQTGARIYFKAENITHDPNLNDFLGLETNGIYYEQIEELSEKMYNIGNSRNGSWYIDPMPIPITLATFNPSQSWIKQRFHEQYMNGRLPSDILYQVALPTDNAFVTSEQMREWDNLDERYKRQFVQGDWTNFDKSGNRWAYAYDPDKHLVDDLQLNPNLPIVLSFDFNRNPICCSICQVQEPHSIDVFETIKLPNSDIYELCEVIRTKYGNKLFIVTGDASGKSSSALVRDNLNYYIAIRQQLGLSNNQIMVPTVNPPLEDNRMLVNSLLSRGVVRLHRSGTKGLQFDLENVAVSDDGKIKKDNRTDVTQQADALDTFRYACNVFLRNFLNVG